MNSCYKERDRVRFSGRLIIFTLKRSVQTRVYPSCVNHPISHVFICCMLVRNVKGKVARLLNHPAAWVANQHEHRSRFM